MINVVFNQCDYNLLPKKREIYDKYSKILQWGRRYPTRFAETFLNLTLTDSQKYVFLSSWVPKTCVWLMSRSSGKLEVLNSKIYPVEKNGPRTIGALKIGDWIYDENNKPVEVIHLNPIIIEEVYEVKFEDGDVIECGKEHLWQVFDKDNNNWFIYETQYMYDKIKQYNSEFYVPLAKFLGEGIKKIISIKRTGNKKPMRCITVDNDTGLYLTGNNYTVTHNSYLSAPFIMVRSLLLASHNTYIMAPSGSQSVETFTKLENLAKNNIASVLGVSTFFLDETVRLNAKADSFTHDKSGHHVALYNGSSINTLNSVVKNIVGIR